MAGRVLPNTDGFPQTAAKEEAHQTQLQYEDADGSTSESEKFEPLEVMFNTGDPHRRKSSLTISSATRPMVTHKRTSCFVHSLLRNTPWQGGEAQESQRKDSHPRPLNDKIPEIPNHPEIQSRLLTKKQLSDMAFSIRELSKRLGHIQLRLKVRNVFILTKAHDETLIHYTREVAKWLLFEAQGGPYIVYVETTLEHNRIFNTQDIIAGDETAKSRLKFWTNELCAKRPQTFDIAIALGGDGTVLYTSWLFQRVVPPVLSFALGSLGFLTKFDYDKFRETLESAFTDGVTVSLRLRLEATIMRSQNREIRSCDLVEELIGEEAEDVRTHKPEMTRDILNDLVLDRGPNATMSSIEVFGDNYHLTTVQADGVCVATPTGSTAYNLAAGGSLCHPDNPVVLVTAICAHTLSFRPIILPDSIVLRLGVPYTARASCWVSFDGRERVELKGGDYVTISASRFPFPTVLPLGKSAEDWIDSLSRTLNWNSRQAQKPFKEWKG